MGESFLGEVVLVADDGDFRVWVRVSLRGFWSGFLFQVRWWLRFVSSVVNCWLVSPVVRWLGNGSSPVWLEVIAGVLFSIFCRWWGRCLVGGCGVVSYF